MSKCLGVLVVVGLLIAAPAMGYAASGLTGGGAKYTLSLTSDYTASPWTSEVGWANRAGAKFVFGAKNLLLGWTDLITETKEAVDSGGNFFVGLGYGLKDSVQNTLGGAVHVATFLITGIDAPLPEGGTQLL